MNCFNGPWLSQAEHIMEPGEILGPILEALATMCGLVQVVLVHHGAHGAVDEDNTLAQQALKCLNFLAGRVHCAAMTVMERAAGFKLKNQHILICRYVPMARRWFGPIWTRKPLNSGHLCGD